MSASNVKWVRLGELIELCTSINKDLLYGEDSVKGMTITKELIPTKADTTGADLSKYLLIEPEDFVYNPRTHGKKIGLGFNNSEETYIISWNNTAFRVKDKTKLYPAYLYMYLNRNEWDRNACFRSWGSSTEVFSWTEFCLMSIPLPDITIQKELVAAYNGLKQLAEENEALIEPLQNACQAYVADCMAKYPMKKLGDQIESFDKRNSTGSNYPFMGINKDKAFMPSFADTSNLDRSKYKVISKGEFVFSGMQTGRDICIRIGLYNEDSPSLLSPAYTTFSVINKDLMPEYLFLQFNRYEMDRYGAFLSDGSIRSNLDWDRFCDIKIPFPPLTVQKAAVDIYNCLEEAKKISSEAREQLKTLCPALVQRASKN